jgi:uncharacterized radical SAM superfamily Fe-S cluster-containing enzyme
MEVFSKRYYGDWESISSFSYGTLLLSSIHFQDAYNMDLERTKRCIVHFGVAMPDDTVKEVSFCTMNTIHRSGIEKQIAKQITAKVKNEFDITTGQEAIEVQPDVARNGGIKKESDQ